MSRKMPPRTMAAAGRQGTAQWQPPSRRAGTGSPADRHPGESTGNHTGEDPRRPVRRTGRADHVRRQQGNSLPPIAGATGSHPHGHHPPADSRSPPGPLPAIAGHVLFPQPHHHGVQMAQASAVQDQAGSRTRLSRAEHIGRLRRHQARHPVRQLHFQMRHPIHVPECIGPQPAPMQRMRHRRDHDLARQQGMETS
jgi:hypothetical protein